MFKIQAVLVVQMVFLLFILIYTEKKQSIATICRLDQILGKQGSKAKDVYASKISLASRVVKVERSVSNLKFFLYIFYLHIEFLLIHQSGTKLYY